MDVFNVPNRVASRLDERRDVRARVSIHVHPEIDAFVEVLVADDAVRNLIRQAKMEQVHSYMHTGGRRGMHTLEQALAQLVQDGDVALPEALAHANDPEQLRRLVDRGRDTEPKVTAAPVG